MSLEKISFKEWSRTPEVRYVLALYRPVFGPVPFAGLKDFLCSFYADCDLTRVLAAETGGDLALSLNPAPAAHVMSWLAQRPDEWRVFYRSAKSGTSASPLDGV